MASLVVFHIEDDATALLYGLDRLYGDTYRVYGFQTKAAIMHAIKTASLSPPDVMLVDLALEGGGKVDDGFEILEFVRNRSEYDHTVMIAVSNVFGAGNKSIDVAAAWMAAGGRATLDKKDPGKVHQLMLDLNLVVIEHKILLNEDRRIVSWQNTPTMLPPQQFLFFKTLVWDYFGRFMSYRDYDVIQQSQGGSFSFTQTAWYQLKFQVEKALNLPQKNTSIGIESGQGSRGYRWRLPEKHGPREDHVVIREKSC